MSFPKNFCPNIIWQNKALKICEDLAQLIFKGVSVFFCSKKLGLPEFVLFELSQTHEKSKSFVSILTQGQSHHTSDPKR